MDEPPRLPGWLAEYVTGRLAEVRASPLDQRPRGEIRGAVDSAVLRGELSAADAEAWLATSLSGLTVVQARSEMSATVHATGPGSVRASSPVPQARRRVEPDQALVVDELLGELSGSPVRLVGVGLFPEEVHVAISLVTTPELWELQRTHDEWRNSLREGARQLPGPPPRGVGQALASLFRLTDDLDTEYECGGMGGADTWVISLDLRYRPAAPQAATRLMVSLLREDSSPVNTIDVALPSQRAG